MVQQREHKGDDPSCKQTEKCESWQLKQRGEEKKGGKTRIPKVQKGPQTDGRKKNQSENIYFFLAQINNNLGRGTASLLPGQ